MQYVYNVIISPIEMIVDLVFKFFTKEISGGYSNNWCQFSHKLSDTSTL